MRPVKIAFGWSRSTDTVISNAIRYLTRPGWAPWGTWGSWSHMFLVFYFADGTAVIHEALMSEGWSCKPSQKLADWIARDPDRHVAEIHWLEKLDPELINLIYQCSSGWLGTRSYAYRQIVAFALAESLLGRWLGLSVYSGPDEVICSEGACRLVGELAPEYDLRASPDHPWDAVSPQAAYDRFMIKEASQPA